MSRKLNVASALQFIVGAWFAIEGLMALFSTESWVRGLMIMVSEELLPPSVSQIQAFNQNLWDFMLFFNKFYGLFALSLSLLFCVIALIPYRRGEKWAWLTMLLIGGFVKVVGGFLILTGMARSFPVIVYTTLFILWIIGLALPAKEIFSKS